VGCADDEQARLRRERLDEDFGGLFAPRLLDHQRRRPTEQSARSRRDLSVELGGDGAHDLAACSDRQAATAQRVRADCNAERRGGSSLERSAKRVSRITRCIGLDQHVDAAAAGESDFEAEFVRRAIRNHHRSPVVENALSAFVDVALDATSAHRARHPATTCHHEPRSGPPGRRTTHTHNGCDGDFFALALPAVEIGEEVSHSGYRGIRASACEPRLLRSGRLPEIA